MSKIIVEDYTKSPKAEEPFDENIIVDFANEMMTALVQTGVSLGLYPREITYGVFLIAENLRNFSILTGANEDDYKDIQEWARVKGEERARQVKESGMVEKIKTVMDSLKKKPSGGESQ